MISLRVRLLGIGGVCRYTCNGVTYVCALVIKPFGSAQGPIQIQIHFNHRGHGENHKEHGGILIENR